MRFATLAPTLGLVLFAALGSTRSATAQAVSYDYDRTANFRAYRTYAWAPGTPLDDELNNGRVTRAVETQMAARGFMRGEPGTRPDVTIAYHASFDRNLEINASGWGGPYFGSGLRTGRATTQQVLAGTIVVTMTDATTGRLVWRATASADVDATKTPEQREKSINRAAEKMFKKYPAAQRSE
jgi:hypothetical protein